MSVLLPANPDTMEVALLLILHSKCQVRGAWRGDDDSTQHCQTSFLISDIVDSIHEHYRQAMRSRLADEYLIQQLYNRFVSFDHFQSCVCLYLSVIIDEFVPAWQDVFF